MHRLIKKKHVFITYLLYFLGFRHSSFPLYFSENYLPVDSCGELSEENIVTLRADFCNNLVRYYLRSDLDECNVDEVFIECINIDEQAVQGYGH